MPTRVCSFVQVGQWRKIQTEKEHQRVMGDQEELITE